MFCFRTIKETYKYKEIKIKLWMTLKAGKSELEFLENY